MTRMFLIIFHSVAIGLTVAMFVFSLLEGHVHWLTAMWVGMTVLQIGIPIATGVLSMPPKS